MNVMFGPILMFLLIFHCLSILGQPIDTNHKIEKAQKENLSKFLETNKTDEKTKITIFSEGSEHAKNNEKATITEAEHLKSSKSAILGSGYVDLEFAGSDDELSSEEILWQPKQEKPEPEKRSSNQSIGKPENLNSEPKHTNMGAYVGPEYKMWETGLVDWKSVEAKKNKANGKHPEENNGNNEGVNKNVNPEYASHITIYRTHKPKYSHSPPEYSAHTSEYSSRRPEQANRREGNQIPLYGGVRPRHVNPVPMVYNWHQMRGVHPGLFRQAHSGPILLRRNSEFEVFHARSAPVYPAGWGPAEQVNWRPAEQAGWNSSEDAFSGSGSEGSRPSSTGSEQPIFEPDPVDFMNALRTKNATPPASEKWYWDKINQNTGPHSPPTKPSGH